MNPPSDIRTLVPKTAMTKAVLMFGCAWVMLASLLGCASIKPTTTTETVVTDSITRRQVERLVAVSVPGDSAKLTTRLVFDERTGHFKPVTIYSHSGHTTLAFTLDAFGLVQASSFTTPFTAQVPVTDTETSRTRAATTKSHTVITEVKTGRFARFCIGFTLVALLLVGGWVYIRFFTPLKFIK